MSRLNDRAFTILQPEVKRLAGDNLALQVQRDIVLRRLEKLRIQTGEPATYEELRAAVSDIYPEFNPDLLRAAAKANQPVQGFGQLISSQLWSKVGIAATVVLGLAGTLYVVNLPYPMIRRPVARTAPILLLPSFMSMDYNYRQAIALVEQADQLVNQATGAADFELGTEKVNQANRHLDALPVWFLGYEPQGYCSFFGCSWRFTLDEFRVARASVGRMEAKLFQEKNALTLLTAGDTAIGRAQQDYQQSQRPADQAAAIGAWQAAIDMLTQIPPETLAGRQAQTKLVAYTRDFQQVSGLSAGTARSNNLIAAAKGFAQPAATLVQNPPHAATTWNQAADLWQDAIARLNQIPVDDPGYLEAQQLLATYQTNLGQIRSRLETERASAEALQQAKRGIENLLALSNTSGNNRLASQIQNIINTLETIQPGTTAHSEAQDLLQSARNKLRELQ